MERSISSRFLQRKEFQVAIQGHARGAGRLKEQVGYPRQGLAAHRKSQGSPSLAWGHQGIHQANRNIGK